TESKNVRIGKGEYNAIKGKCVVFIACYSGTKLITDVLYVPDIDQNLLSVGQFIEKGFKVIFIEKTCVIKDATGQKMLEVKMAERIGSQYYVAFIDYFTRMCWIFFLKFKSEVAGVF
ncbi:hypothetical protein J1N35_025810, partial [Gossypium stocksii]